MNGPQQRALLTSTQAAEYLGVQPQTLAQWRWRKTGPAFVKVGRLVRYEAESLEAWLAEGGVAS